MTQERLKEQVAELSSKYRPPNREKLDRYTRRIDGIIEYYDDRISEAGPGSGKAILFAKFVHALAHTRTLVKMYRNLTRKLDKLAKEVDDETRTNSKS